MSRYNYEQIIDRIENTRRFGNKTGVEITADMMRKLGNIHTEIPFIHVAGTNGKGSVCAFIGSILKEAGLKVGVFTSPHLVHFEERIAVDGKQISKEDVTRIGNIILATDFEVEPTYFDYCLAIAIVYFVETKCDIMVIETGLGGRLDSTNALGVPLVSVITKIGYDHMAILGDKLDMIAAEKAGIIKNGSYVVIEQQEEEAKEVMCQRLIDEQIKDYHFVDSDDISYTRTVGISLLGVHQYENAAAAMKAAEYTLGRFGCEPLKIRNSIENGLRKARWHGRMELISLEPFVMVDGAHNGHGVDALKNSLMMLYPNEKFDFYFAVMADKDYPKMIEEIVPLAASFTTVTLENERAAQAGELAQCIRAKGVEVKAISDVDDLIRMLRAGYERKNIVFGSLYFVGEVIQKWYKL